MKIIDNVTEIVRDDLMQTIKRGSKVSVAAACFSMYAYQELKRQLEQVRNSVLSLPLRPLSKSNLKSNGGNFTFQGSAEKPVCTEQNLRSSCVMR